MTQSLRRVAIVGGVRLQSCCVTITDADLDDASATVKAGIALLRGGPLHFTARESTVAAVPQRHIELGGTLG